MNRQMVWHRPAETASTDWLSGLNAMQQLRATVIADDDLSQRIDSLVGTEILAHPSGPQRRPRYTHLDTTDR